MGERDAFGNGKVKDTPAERPDADINEAFGAIATPPPAPPPVRIAASPSVPRSTSAFSGMRVLGLALRFAVPLIVLGVFGTTVFSVGNKVSDSVQDARRAISTSFDSITIPTTPTVTSSTGPATATAPPVGLGRGSLLKTGNFRRALHTLQAEGSRARSVRVAADRIDAQLVTASGFIRQVQVTWQGARQRLSQTGPGFSQTGTFRLFSLDVNAPLRLARSASGRAKRSASSVDYLVAITTGLEPQGWTVILKNGKGQYLADVHGRITRRIN